MKKKVGSLEALLAGGDYVIISIGFLLSYYLRFDDMSNLFRSKFFAFWLFMLLVWSVTSYSFRLYAKFFSQDRSAQTFLWLQVIVVHLIVVIAFNGLIKTFFSRQVILGTYVVMFLLHFLWRVIFRALVKNYYSKGDNARKAIVVGAFFEEDFIRFIERNTPTGVDVKGYFGEKFASKYNYLGERQDVLSYLRSEADNIDEIYCSLSRMKVEEVKSIVEFADNHLIRVMFIPDQKGIPYSKLNLDFFGHVPVLTLRHLSVDELPNRAVKRIFDFVFSSFVMLFLLSWLIPVMAVIIKLDSKGPVFFVQKRSGKKKRLFGCLKFRTMTVNAEANSKQAEKGDKRITKVGAFLRKTSLDELPQFINVWLGHMSVVGPRPHMVSHTEEYRKAVNKFMVRHLVKPGITGLSQVMGLRGDTKNINQMRNRVRIDIFYLENWSFQLDMKIIGQTIANMIKGDDSAF